MKNNKAYTKKVVKELCKRIETLAIQNIERSLNCGAIAENSELRKDNHLLGTMLVMLASKEIRLSSDASKKEFENLSKFI